MQYEKSSPYIHKCRLDDGRPCWIVVSLAVRTWDDAAVPTFWNCYGVDGIVTFHDLHHLIGYTENLIEVEFYQSLPIAKINLDEISDFLQGWRGTFGSAFLSEEAAKKTLEEVICYETMIALANLGNKAII